MFWTFGFPLLLTIALGHRLSQPAARSGRRSRWRPAAEAARIRARSQRRPRCRSQLLDADRAAQAALRTGKVSVVVVAGHAARPIASIRPAPRRGWRARIVDDVLQRADGPRRPTPTAEARITAPGSRYIDFLVPGLLGMGLM